MRKGRGFTLIELMVVLLIIGLAIGMVNFSLGGNEARKARDQFEQLFQLLRYADEDAALQGDAVGLHLETSLRGELVLNWKRFRIGGWVDAQSPFEAITVPPYMQLELRIDDAPVNLQKEFESPQLVFSGSGEITPFELRLKVGDERAGMIAVDLTGDLIKADSYED